MLNWKRGILIAIALWVLIFFEVSILMFGFKLSSPNPNYYFAHYLLLTIFIIVLSLYYFSEKTKENLRGFSGHLKSKNKKISNEVKKGVIKGVVLGILFVITEIILDSLITIPLFIIPQGGSYTSFLLSPEMLASDLLTIILATIVGWIQGIKK